MSTLSEIDAEHEKQAVAIVKKELSAIGWDSINPNDICWMLHDPQVDKQKGRSKRVFNRLQSLEAVAWED